MPSLAADFDAGDRIYRDAAGKMVDETLKALESKRAKTAWNRMIDDGGTLKSRVKEITTVEAISGARIKREGRNAFETRPTLGFKKRSTMVTYACSYGLTLEAREYVETKKTGRMIDAMTRSFEKQRELMAAALFGNGSVTNLALIPRIDGLPIVDTFTPDGRSFFNSAHVFRNQRPYSNRLDSSPLTADTLETILQRMNRWTDADGAYLYYRPKLLVVPSELEGDAMRALQSKGRPGTNFHDPNVIQESYGENSYLVAPYLQSPSNWYVRTDSVNQVKRVYGIPLRQMKTEDQINPQNFNSWVGMVEAYMQYVEDPLSYFGVLNAVS